MARDVFCKSGGARWSLVWGFVVYNTRATKGGKQYALK